MELQHVSIKILVEGELQVDPRAFIDVFHRWIRDEVVDELLIDVADYRHVPAGPAVLLVGHQADYCMDHTGDRWGLRYNRKAPVEGTDLDRFGQALRAALIACGLLEGEFPGPDRMIHFSRTELQLSINDRALAPNLPETYEKHQTVVRAFLADTFGDGGFELSRPADPRSLFGLTIKLAKPYDPPSVIDRLSASN